MTGQGELDREGGGRKETACGNGLKEPASKTGRPGRERVIERNKGKKEAEAFYWGKRGVHLGESRAGKKDLTH